MQSSWFVHDLFQILRISIWACLFLKCSQKFSNLLHRPLVGFPKVTASHIDLGASGKGHMKCEEYDGNMSLKKKKNMKKKQKMFNIHKFHKLLGMAVEQVEVDTVVEYFWPYRCVTAAWPQHHQAVRSFWASSPHKQEMGCLKSWVVDSNWDIHWH